MTDPSSDSSKYFTVYFYTSIDVGFWCFSFVCYIWKSNFLHLFLFLPKILCLLNIRLMLHIYITSYELCMILPQFQSFASSFFVSLPYNEFLVKAIKNSVCKYTNANHSPQREWEKITVNERKQEMRKIHIFITWTIYTLSYGTVEPWHCIIDSIWCWQHPWRTTVCFCLHLYLISSVNNMWCSTVDMMCYVHYASENANHIRYRRVSHVG